MEPATDHLHLGQTSGKTAADSGKNQCQSRRDTAQVQAVFNSRFLPVEKMKFIEKFHNKIYFYTIESHH